MAVLGKRPQMFDVTFLERGAVAAKAVSRITIRDGSDNNHHATGFLIAEDWLLTTHHALFSSPGHPSPYPQEVVTLFDYVWSDGVPLAGVERRGKVDSIVGDSEHDWAAIQLERRMPKRFPSLPLNPQRIVGIGDPVFIVQHPLGEPKKVAFARDPISYTDDNVLQYGTDTQPGSSGAPVFNESWEVVGMHHSGGWIARPNVDRRIFLNQGIRIERIAAGLRTKGVPFEGRSGSRGLGGRVYISVHPADLKFAEDLEKHLAPLKNAGRISVWHWAKATPGSTLLNEARREMDAAELILFIVSPDYLNSTEHLEESRSAVERSRRESVRAVPILARPSSWEFSSFGELQPLPQNRRPLVLHPNIDEAYVDIAKSVGAVMVDNDF